MNELAGPACGASDGINFVGLIFYRFAVALASKAVMGTGMALDGLEML